MTDKYLLFNLDDEKSKKLGEVISNSTARKIVNFLAEKEASEGDIAEELGLRLNTVGYNIKKLLGAGVIEKSKDFFWSKKGKKIPVYRVANKLLVISPKKSGVTSKLKSIIPVVFLSAVFTWFVLWVGRTKDVANDMVPTMLEKGVAASAAGEGANLIYPSGFSYVSWFLIGLWLAVVIFVGWITLSGNNQS